MATGEHPLERSLARLYDGPGSPLPRLPERHAATLPLAAFLEAGLADRLALVARDATPRELRPAAMDLVGELVWRIATPSVGVWADAARALPPHVARVAVEPLLVPFPSLPVRPASGPFACLSGDPDERHQDATIVDGSALVAAWTGPLAGETVPAIVAAQLALVGGAVDEAALLASAADAVANAFLGVGRRLRRERELGDAARRIVGALPGGLGIEVELETLELDAGSVTYAVKTGCCASYARVGGRRCATCPDRTRESRAREMRLARG